MGLRERQEKDLQTVLEGKWGTPVSVIYPNGEKQEFKAGSTTESLKGQVIYPRLVDDPDTGEQIVLDKYVATLRRTSLDQDINDQNYQSVFLQFPITNDTTSPKVTFSIDRPPEGGQTLGTVRLYCIATKQSTP